MLVLRLEIRNFRGLRDITIRPRSHVLLVGEPRAGRSTVVEALRRSLSSDATRQPLLDDLDFYNRDTSIPVEVEVTLGELGPALEQEFFDQLEPWDADECRVVTEIADPTEFDDESLVYAVRVCYRAQWSANDERAEHWVDFPKASDPSAGVYARVPRRLLQQLPCVFVDPNTRPLSFGARNAFRALVEGADGDDFADALEELMSDVESAADAFSDTKQVSQALGAVIQPLRNSLALGSTPAEEIVRFLPDGGSLAGVMRSLGASLKIDGSLSLPLARHGSTTLEMLRAAEALAARDAGGIAVVDDFGENLDSATSSHLAAVYRSCFDQVWLSTRRGSGAGESFRADEIVRLVGPWRPSERVHQGKVAKTRSARVAARHLALQMLPAIASRSIVVLEGPHDRAGLTAVASRRFRVASEPLPAAHGIAFADAGAADRSGGAGAAVKLAAYVQELGFLVITVLDGDRAGDEAEAAAVAVSDAVIRLPRGHAIERALVEGVSDDDLLKALERLQAAYGVDLPASLGGVPSAQLRKAACEILKSGGGLHGQFVELLPSRSVPPVASRVLDSIREASRGALTGVVAL